MNPVARNKSVEFFNHHQAVVANDKQLAYRLLCSAATVDPTNARAWYGLGCALIDLKLPVAASAAFRRALALPDGDRPEVGDMSPQLRAMSLVNLGQSLLGAGLIDEALEASNEALKFLEDRPELDVEGRAFAYSNMSLIVSVLGDTEASMRFAHRAHEISSAAIVETGVALALMRAGDYAAGLSHFGARFAYRKDLNHHLDWPYPVWDGTSAGTLLLASEQGIGDTLSFARFVPAAARLATRVLFQVHPELFRLMSAAFQGWPKVEVIPQSVQFPVADVWCPVFSLPTALGLTTEQIRDQPQMWRMPYGSSLAPKGWKAEDARLHIGIAYAGSPLNDIDKWRSIPVWRFFDLYRVPGIQLYSLQVGERVVDLHSVGAAGLIRDMSPYIKDATDTVSIMRELDMVITIESFLGHLAGAMDKECWIPYSRRGGDWRIGRTRETSLWYPNHRIFRQGEDMEWPGVFDRMVEALNERLA